MKISVNFVSYTNVKSHLFLRLGIAPNLLTLRFIKTQDLEEVSVEHLTQSYILASFHCWYPKATQLPNPTVSGTQLSNAIPPHIPLIQLVNKAKLSLLLLWLTTLTELCLCLQKAKSRSDINWEVEAWFKVGLPMCRLD